VRDGVNGLLVPPRDPGRLAAAIDRILGDEQLAASMAAAGRASASGHSIGALADATLAAYEAVRGRVVERRRAEIRLVNTP
jgi:glycosyltransferase involved in cell wall biosynthesis